ncbi:type III pantothenate kinase [Tautonia sociabilis]|uniref:type III pantothenate kinase n=1 Tax=Tautonia sociabilis TaxID=2080755 RepID=UPI0013158CBA|nr:type III pantothenate kinase [Tautonia sociabilis]
MASSIVLIDVGNTRIKAGCANADGVIRWSWAGSLSDGSTWESLGDRLSAIEAAGVAIASVNPPAADRIGEMLGRLGIGPIRWFRSANDVPVCHRLEAPSRTGADRALAVLAALDRAGRIGPGIVVQCGTAITVERIEADGCWAGGAIAIGPGLASRSLRSGTAQLPEVGPTIPEAPLPPWGASPEPALRAGIVWGTVGAIRELIARQSEGFDRDPWVAWTGGDAPALAMLLGREHPWIEPSLVLRGLLVAVAWGSESRSPHPESG